MTQQSILVVDDEPSMCKLLSSNLKASGYAVRSAADGTEALQLIEEHPFDLLLLDVNLPGPNGLHVLQAVRRGADMPVLILSARVRECHKVEVHGLPAPGPPVLVMLPIRCSVVTQRVPFDLADYERRTREGPCFICAIAAGVPDYRGPTTMIYEDSDILVFLNRYPTLRGYTLVCPRRHIEQVVGDVTAREYLELQHWIYRVGQAVQQVVPTERLYILSLGSQQGNRHVHWHLAPLPPGVPYQDQQLAALAMRRGLLSITPREMMELATEIRDRLVGH